VSGTATTLDVDSDDASNTIVNAAATPIPFGPTALVTNQALTIALPASPSTIGTWTAIDSGTMSFKPGAVIISATFSGGFGATATLTCNPTANTTVFATTSVP
jgi:hypothetical protein